MSLPRVRFTIRRLMVAVAVMSLVAALGRYIVLGPRKDPVPTNAVEALAHAARCAERRVRDFHLEEYDAEVTRLKPGALAGIFRVRFVKRDERGERVLEISYAIQDAGYCMEIVAVRAPNPDPPSPE